MTIVPVFYQQKYKEKWDVFIDNSKNGTFLFKRDYMEYHSDRFEDYSIMFFDDGKLIALLPASTKNNEVSSHGGLTYGGIVTDNKMKTSKMLEVFDAMILFLKQHNKDLLIYKKIPQVYHLYPSDEDLYALFKNNAVLYRRDISTSILLDNKIKYNERRKRNIKKALKENLIVEQSDDYDNYIDIMNEILIKYHNTRAVHTGCELRYLAAKFPNNIKLFVSKNQKGKMLAGVLIFDTEQTVHAQYIANSDEGKNIGALDIVIDYLINEYSIGKKFFDFGISTEDNGNFLNVGLITQKEEFGGRGIVHDFYKLSIK